MNDLKFSEFSLDLDAIANYCTIGGVNETSTKKSNEFRQQEISNNYQLNDDDNLILAEKIVHEVITPQDTPLYDTLKTDLVKGLLSTLLEEKERNVKNDLPKISLPGLITIQTFIDYGFLKINKE